MCPQQESGQDHEELPEAVKNNRDWFRQALEKAGDKQNEAYNRMKLQYTPGVPYEPGDLVMVALQKRRVGVSPKLQQTWTGPWKILEKINEQQFRLQHLKSRKVLMAHRQRMVPTTLSRYQGDERATKQSLWDTTQAMGSTAVGEQPSEQPRPRPVEPKPLSQRSQKSRKRGAEPGQEDDRQKLVVPEPQQAPQEAPEMEYTRQWAAQQPQWPAAPEDQAKQKQEAFRKTKAKSELTRSIRPLKATKTGKASQAQRAMNPY